MTAVPHLLALLPAMAPNPIDEGTLRPGLDPSQVTPGVLGFLMTLLLAVAVIFLVRDFNRRNRRLRYRAEYAERRAAEERLGGYADDRGPGGDASGEDASGEDPVAPDEEPEGPDRRG
jgi:hypothetical protein